MQQIILILLIIIMMRRRRDGVLGCGIIAFAPIKKQKANLDWIKLMLVYNASRGTDSCGVFMNNTLRKGINANSDARDWLTNNKLVYQDDCKNRAIIGHCRSASSGGKTEFTAHPFLFEYEGRQIILTHNGTVDNSYQLCKQYEVNEDILTVDSQRMAKLILEAGYEVLDKYTGKAVFVWSYSDDPGAVYIFKGASKTSSYQKDLDDERPLFFVQNTEGTYISSMREPLDAMCDQDLVVYTPNQNEVTRIKDNELSVIYTADRTSVNVKEVVPYKGGNFLGRGRDEEDMYSEEYWDRLEQGIGPSENSHRPIIPHKTIPLPNVSAIHSIGKAINTPSDFYCELTYGSATKYLRDVIYYVGGRYYMFPSPVEGVYTKNMHGVDDGFHTSPDAGIDDYLMHGWYEVRYWNATNYEARKAMERPKVDWPTSSMQYFYRGVLINSTRVNDFNKKNHTDRFDIMVNPFERMRQLSAFAKYPITFSYEESLDLLQTFSEAYLQWYVGGNLMKAMGVSFSPLYTNRQYYINSKAQLISIRTDSPIDRILNSNASEKLITITDDVLKDNIKADEEYTTLIEIGEYAICRMRKVHESSESDLLMEENFNGVADVEYFIKYKDGLPIKIEDYGIEGKQITMQAMKNFVEDVIPLEPEKVMGVVINMIREGEECGDGVVKWMQATNNVNFNSLILDVLQDWSTDIIAQAEHEEKEMDAAIAKLQMKEDLFNGSESLYARTQKAMSHRAMEEKSLKFKTRENHGSASD